jgi:hypothetical protein
MFKKTLIAAAVATTASFGAAASSVDVTNTVIGVEYAQGKKQISAQNVNVVLGRDYSAGDIITVTVAGADIVTVDEDDKAIVLADPNTSLEFLGFQDNAVRYLVTEDFAEGDDDASFTVEELMLDISGAADKATVKVSAAGRVDTVDGPINVDAATPGTAYTFASELSSKVTTKFDAVVDVNAQREAFTDAGTQDTLTVSTTLAETAEDYGVTTTEQTFTVYGDFSYLDADGDGELGGDDDGTVLIGGAAATVADDFSSASLDVDFAAATAGTTSVDIVVTGPDDTVIPDQSFMVSVDVAYENPADDTKELSKTTLDKTAAGSWTLNGAKAHIPLMYVGSNYAQAVTVSNTSTQTGGVDVTVYVGDDAVTFEGVDTVAAEGVTDISAAIQKAIKDAGVTTGVVAFDVVVNTPSAATTIKALYFTKSDKDRVLTK